MKVLLTNGSPHEKGCTYIALKEIAATLADEGVDSEIFWLGNEPIGSCIGCGVCRVNKNGCFRDDIVNKFIAKIDDFDGFIFGSPVHYAAASGALSSFMDRVFFASSSKFYLKPAAAVVSCRRGGATAAFDEINKYFAMSNMPIVPSQYWNQIHGSNAEEAAKDLEGLQTMRTLARNMAYMIKCFKAGSEKGIVAPTKEPTIRTNFIR